MATRREKVVLELEDHFTSGMARAAAATAVLDKNLNSLSGSAVTSDRELERTRKTIGGIGSEVDRTTQSTRRGGQELDRYSGRLRLITDAALTLGPAVVPIGAVAVPAVLAFTAGLGAAAGALGVTILAVNGLGDALESLNAYQLEPTADNLEAMRAEFDKIGPAGAAFVTYLDSLEPQLRELQQLARLGLLPGVESGINVLLQTLPQLRVMIFNLAEAMGALAGDAAAGLTGPQWRSFFDYIQNEGGPLLTSFAHTIGNVGTGLASLLVAFGPLTGSFAAGMERLSQSFADWAAGVSQTQGFQDFVAYIRDTGPQVVALLGAIGTAFIGILRAAAPVGDAVLPALTALATALGTIADSPVGPALFTAAAAMLALNRAAIITTASLARLKVTADGASLSAAKFGAGVSFIAIITGIAGVNAAFSSLRNNIDDLDLDRNLAALARNESVADLANLGKELSNVNSGLTSFNDKLSDTFTLGFDTSELERSQKEIEKVDQALASMVESGRSDVAAEAFEKIVGQADAAGVSAEDTAKAFDAYQTALANLAPATDAAAAAQDRYTQANQSAARVTALTRTQVAGLTRAMEDQRSTALATFDAVTQYGNAVDEARKQAKNSNAGLDASTNAGRKNRDALSQLAAAWNNQGDAIRNNEGKFRAARKNFIETATAMGAPIQKARELADRLLEIPRQRVVDIKLYGSEAAASAISRIRRELLTLPKSIRTDYYVNQVNSISRPRGPVAQADGGTVPKTGRHYADRHHYLLADGEEVISNRRGQADRYRPLLKAINNAADGATVGRRSVFALPGQITRGSSVAEAVEAIGDLRVTIRGLNVAIKESDKAIRRETRERDRLSDKVDKNQAEVDRLTGLYDNLAGAIGTGLAANQFETGDAWASTGGLPGIIANLDASTANANAFSAATGALTGQLSGAALESVLRQGLTTTQMFAGLPPELLAQYQTAFDTNAAAVTAAGAVGGSAVYGSDLAAANQTLGQSQQELAEQTAELKLITRQNAAAERQRDKAEKTLGQVKEALNDIRSEIKKARGDAESGTRSKR